MFCLLVTPETIVVNCVHNHARAALRVDLLQYIDVLLVVRCYQVLVPALPVLLLLQGDLTLNVVGLITI